MAKTSPMIGANVGRVEGTEKVNGSAVYGADVHFADTLWGKILRSPYPHARIKNIDTSKAWKVAGRESDCHGQGRAGSLSRQEYPRYSSFMLG